MEGFPGKYPIWSRPFPLGPDVVLQLRGLRLPQLLQVSWESPADVNALHTLNKKEVSKQFDALDECLRHFLKILKI